MASEKNPLASYLSEKTAAPGDFMSGVASKMAPKQLGRSVGGALVGAGAAGAVGLAGLAAQKIMDAATKARDFRQMLSYDAQLAQRHAEEPQLVNQMFSTLRAFNPAFTKDPVVAGSYLHQMLDNPEQAGSVATEALTHRDKARPQIPMGDMMLRSALGGAQGGSRGGRERPSE